MEKKEILFTKKSLMHFVWYCRNKWVFKDDPDGPLEDEQYFKEWFKSLHHDDPNKYEFSGDLFLKKRDLTISECVEYEVKSSRWASWASWGWAQEIAGRYFAWKTSRKYARYKMSKIREEKLKKNL